MSQSQNARCLPVVVKRALITLGFPGGAHRDGVESVAALAARRASSARSQA